MTIDTAITPPPHAQTGSAPDGAESQTVRHLPGDTAVWFFIIGDMVIFSCYFAAYMYDRGQHQALFLQAQQHLSQGLGIINTLILLTSSLLVALGVQANRNRDSALALRLITGGIACGVAFLLIKACEWYLKLRIGVTISTDVFFMHYYMLTAIHFCHVVLGLVILSLLRQELRADKPSDAQLLEVGACYWHMVDFLWIIIFALLYLVR